MRTILAILVLVNYACAGLMVLTVKVSAKRFDGVKYFLANFVLLSAGITLALFRPLIPQLFSIILANACMFAGIVAVAFGAGRFTGRDILRSPYCVYSAVFLVAYSYFTYAVPDIRVRTMLFSGMVLPIFCHIAFVFLRPSDGGHHRHCMFAGITYVLFSILYMFRFYCAFVGDDIPEYFSAHSPDAVINILTIILTIFLMYSIQHMIGRRLLAELEYFMDVQSDMLVEMKDMAIRDHLTGIYNRRKIEETLKREREQFERYGNPLSLILCDIDTFKAINDTFGHDVGDKVIVHITGLIAGHKRDADRIGRWGGEEFIIVSPQTTLEQATMMAERFRSIVESNQPECVGGERPVTISLGVAQFSSGMSVEDFVKCADEALYGAKQHGRNRVEVSPCAHG
ncbi:GGDEF domain-containing protein [Desulfobaculum xiamenense]|nr:GGDEF domain-containing protein [Desulfobaculum xiamenense]